MPVEQLSEQELVEQIQQDQVVWRVAHPVACGSHRAQPLAYRALRAGPELVMLSLVHDGHETTYHHHEGRWGRETLGLRFRLTAAAAWDLAVEEWRDELKELEDALAEHRRAGERLNRTREVWEGKGARPC